MKFFGYQDPKMYTEEEHLIFLGRSYGKPLNRREWDALHPENPATKVLRKLGLKTWTEFLQQSGYNVTPFTKEDMIRYGRALGTDISHIKSEEWDYFVHLPKLKNERIPESADIFLEFGSWKNFQKAVLTKPSLRTKEEKRLEQIEEFFLQGLIPRNIARRMGLAGKKVEEYIQSIGFFTPEFIQHHFPTLEEITNKQIMNIKFFGGEEKKVVRDLMLQEVSHLQNSQQLRYCGLPGPNFIDYAALAKTFGIISQESLTAEYDKVSGYVMLSLIRNWNKIQGGEIFRQLKLYLGNIENALKEKRYEGMRFNIINFDWVGGWAKDKYSAIKNLFHSHLADEAILFITLNNSPFERGRAFHGRNYMLEYHSGDHHIDIAKNSIENLANHHAYKVKELFRLSYQDTFEMVTAAYLIKRK